MRSSTARPEEAGGEVGGGFAVRRKVVEAAAVGVNGLVPYDEETDVSG